MADFKGGIELISGLKPKNNQDFPLVRAQDVAFYEEGKEIRLDKKIENLKSEFTISDATKQEIAGAATELVFDDARFETINTKLEKVDELDLAVTGEGGLKSRVETLEEKAKGDNDKLKIQYEESESLLYLFEGDELQKPDLENNIEGNVISTTTVKGGGGGGGNTLAYKITLTSPDENSANMFFADSDKVIINYRGNLIDLNSENENDNLMSATLTYRLTIEQSNGAKKTITFKEASNTDLSYDLTKLLGLGKNNITMVVSYSELLEGEEKPTTITARKSWGITVVNLSLTINEFNYNTIQTRNVYINYTLKGDLTKTLHWRIDGGDWQSKSDISVFEYSDNLAIPSQSHGSHTVEIYATGTKTGSTVNIETKPHKVLDIMFADPNSDVPVIRAVADVSAEKQQYGLIPISYTVYQRGKDKVDITLTVESNGEIESTSTRNVSTLTEYSWDYRPLTEGLKTLTITCGEASKVLTLDIAKFPYEVKPVETNLVFDFNPEGRTNEDSDFDIFEDRGINWTVSENFDWSNGGWRTDEEGSSYFCIKAGTHIKINHNLFEDANTLGSSARQGNGKEFKVIFKTTNVADSRATWLSCLSKTETGEDAGIKMNIQNGYVYSSLKDLTIPYSEEDIIEFDMNIVPFGSTNEKNIPMVMTYEDGTPVQPVVLTDEATSFTQENPVPITIGSTDCDVHLYRMKAYSAFLTDKQILDNFIADARSGTEKADRYLRNQIYDALTGQLSPEGLANACPDLRIIKISAPHFTEGKVNGKWQKIDNTTIEMIYKNGREEDNWIATNAMHTGQGTSSNAYGQAGRNIDISMKDKDGAIITIKDTGQVVKKVNLTADSVPVNYFNIKLNIASSENANNALLQKRFDRYLPYIPGSRVHTQHAKTTMEFFNCVVFVQETGGEDTPHIEFSDTNYHFYGIGNIGDSKKTDSSRASDPDDPNEFCVEIMDWNRDLSSFPEDTKVKASKYIVKNDAGEITDYGFLVADNLNKTEADAEPKLYEKQGNGSYVLTKDTEIDMHNLDKYYVDILLNDDFSEDYTYGFRYLNDDKNSEQIAAAKAKWIEFYRFITRDLTTNGVEDKTKVDQWKKEFADWCIEDAAFYFYIYTLRYTMVDNRAKNTFWHYGKVATTNENGEVVYATDKNGDYIYKFDFWDYDNDTALGIDNAGKLEMDYGVEDDDKDLAAGNDENSSPTYFRAANSTFFQRIIKYFADEVAAGYANYESKAVALFDSEHLISEFDNWQSQFPEELWRLDYERKYKRPYVNGGGANWDNAIKWSADDKRYLTDMMNGKKKYQRRQFERNQDFYMSSKFRGSKNARDMITLRGAGDLSGADLVIKQDATLNITPYLNMYINLSQDNTGGYYEKFKAKAGETYSFPYPSEKFEFAYIYGASRIQSLGDLSPMYLQTATLGFGEKLREIILGNDTPGYQNGNIKSLENSISTNNKLLEVLNIENLNNITGSLPVSNIPSIKEVYAKGSGITSVTFARNGLIRKAELPTTVQDIRLYDLYYLNDLTISDYDKLNIFVWENTPNIDEQDIIQRANNLIRIRAIDIDWTGDKKLEDASILVKLSNCKGIDANNTNVDYPVLTGRVELNSIRQSEIDKFTVLWPELELIYEEDKVIPQHRLRFYCEGVEIEPDKPILKDRMHILTKADDPAEDFLARGLLTKPKTAQYEYVFKKWLETFEGTPVDRDLEFHAEFDEIVRVYTVSWYTDTNAKEIIINKKGEYATVEVPYGESAVYDQEKFGIPAITKNDNHYYIFSRWDKSTGFIEEDLKVCPVWKKSQGSFSAPSSSRDLTAEQINALTKYNNGNNLNNYITDGDAITVQLGYMPDYGGDVLISQDTEFTGVNSPSIVVTDYKLFNEDKSFVLAIDFTMKYKSSGTNTLVSCTNQYRGFKLYSTSSAAPSIVYDGTAEATVSNYSIQNPEDDNFSGYNREICVIRKKKGDPTLYIYRNNRYSSTPVEEVKLKSTSSRTSDDKLCIGASYNSVAGYSDYGVGTIHYAKIWEQDLGEDECKKICSWTYSTMTFKNCATQLYSTPEIVDGEVYESYFTSQMSFIAEFLLERPLQFDSTFYLKPTDPNDPNNPDKQEGSWATSTLRSWLNSKVFAGLSIEWQQIITPVVIKSLKYPKNDKDAVENNPTITRSADKLYIPAGGELDASLSADPVYKLEITKPILYSPYDTQAERAITYPDGRIGRWWTRTPAKSESAHTSQVVVNLSGQIVEGGYMWEGKYGNAFSQRTEGNQFGVLIGFSIGG